MGKQVSLWRIAIKRRRRSAPPVHTTPESPPQSKRLHVRSEFTVEWVCIPWTRGVCVSDQRVFNVFRACAPRKFHVVHKIYTRPGPLINYVTLYECDDDKEVYIFECCAVCEYQIWSLTRTLNALKIGEPTQKTVTRQNPNTLYRCGTLQELYCHCLAPKICKRQTQGIELEIISWIVP